MKNLAFILVLLYASTVFAAGSTTINGPLNFNNGLPMHELLVTGAPSSTIPAVCSVSMFEGWVPTDGEVFLRYTFPYACNFPTGQTSSYAKMVTSPTGSDSYVVKKNNVQIGTVLFTAGGTVGSFVGFSAQLFNAGDDIEVDAPSPADAVAKGLYITFSGLRQ